MEEEKQDPKEPKIIKIVDVLMSLLLLLVVFSEKLPDDFHGTSIVLFVLSLWVGWIFLFTPIMKIKLDTGNTILTFGQKLCFAVQIMLYCVHLMCLYMILLTNIQLDFIYWIAGITYLAVIVVDGIRISVDFIARKATNNNIKLGSNIVMHMLILTNIAFFLWKVDVPNARIKLDNLIIPDTINARKLDYSNYREGLNMFTYPSVEIRDREFIERIIKEIRGQEVYAVGIIDEIIDSKINPKGQFGYHIYVTYDSKIDKKLEDGYLHILTVDDTGYAVAEEYHKNRSLLRNSFIKYRIKLSSDTVQQLFKRYEEKVR